MGLLEEALDACERLTFVLGVFGKGPSAFAKRGVIKLLIGIGVGFGGGFEVQTRGERQEDVVRKAGGFGAHLSVLS